MIKTTAIVLNVQLGQELWAWLLLLHVATELGALHIDTKLDRSLITATIVTMLRILFFHACCFIHRRLCVCQENLQVDLVTFVIHFPTTLILP